MSHNQPQVGFVMKSNPSQQQPFPAPTYPNYPPQNTPYPPSNYQHQPFPAPIQTQPPFGGTNQWSDELHNATSFHVKQKVEMLEIITGWETENRYTVKDQAGKKIFYVMESSDLCSRLCCGRMRPFTLLVKDARGQNVLNFERPLDCACFCACCRPDTMSINTANGQKLGSVKEKCGLIFPSLSLKNAANQTVLKAEGPWCPTAFACGQSIVFKLATPQGVSVGTISKEWSGLVRELFTDADYFSISFPVDLDPAMKAVCLGALFLIDYEYFEASGGHQGGRRLFG